MLKTINLNYHQKQKSIIKNVNLTINSGIVFGVIGPNGAGKTSLLKVLSGLFRPTSGTVLWNNSELLKQSRKEICKAMAFVSQNQMVNFAFTVEEIVKMGRYPHDDMCTRKKRYTNSDIIEWALHKVDATHLRTRPIIQLSSGERQRIFIARALASEAPILLLDEPTANLDIKHQMDVWLLLKELSQTNIEKNHENNNRPINDRHINDKRIIIVANNDLVATKTFCDEVAVLDEGCCLASGKTTEIMENSKIKKIFGIPDNYMLPW